MVATGMQWAAELSQGETRAAPLSSEIPPRPPGTDVDENIRETRRLSQLEPEGALADWINKVRRGGEWDYKRWGPYNDFGNFNYGATGRALGFPREVLMRAAGAVQMFDAWWKGKPSGPGSPLGDPPYGDFPPSQEMIERGMNYYDRNYYGRRLP
jgi:hypothetical protein